MNIVIIDDEKLAIDILAIVLEELTQFSICIKGTFTDAMDAFDLFEREQIDLVFLDMEMLDVHGLQIAKLILAKYPQIQLIFVTAHAQFAVDAFDVAATDYLLKPVQEQRLEKAMIKAQQVYDTRKEQRNDDKNEILYVRVFGGFQLLDAGQQTVKWRTKKVSELFLFLWLHQKKPLLNVVIMENLWPEVDPEKASVNLHTTMYQLRKTLKQYGSENPILLVNNHYQLIKKIDSDYEQLLALIEREQHDEQSIQQILNCYEDDFLAAEEYSWAVRIRIRLKQAVVNVLESYVATTKEINSLLKLNCLQKMVELEEYNEQYMLLLLQFLIEQNKKQACKQFYETIQEKLQEELNIPIPEKMNELYKEYMERA
ncbi:response regulator [Paenibacillus sp. 1011MAR3C5]|uniref:response regulator n=1 Tax=Paenibacillus sp. 1011MAR3C5 TaxID=1675787 RepID=UPI000E6C5FFC|nr:response regulator [Paenibacillus sp. 1011MAR3C5]RJE85075.1 response regulator [Paenibacillus sp. 1011MAR3C5]